MRIKHQTRRIGLMVFVIALLFATGCTSSYERSEKPAGDWSRGLLLGESNIKQSAALQVDTEGRVHMVWIEIPSGEQGTLRYAQLDREGRVTVDKALPIDLAQPRRPQLLVDGDGDLHLAFLHRSDGEQLLYHVQIDSAGGTTEPVRVSRDGEHVDGFRMFQTPREKGLQFVSASELDNGDAGIYHHAFDGNGINSTHLLVPEGIDPFVLVESPSSSGNSGTTHLIWLYGKGFSKREIYYARLEEGQLTPSNGEHITTFGFSESAAYQPPVLGLDSDTVYVLWSIQNMGGGLTPTAADTYYISFLPGEPSYFDPQNLKLPSEHRPDHVAHTSPYQISELTLLSPDIYSTDFINAPAVVASKKSELPIVVSLIIESASKQFMQLGLAVLADGEAVGYQLANETSNASVLPTLVADQDGNLHLAWLDTAGFRRYKVYYATTSPEATAWLNRTTVEDVGERAATLAFGVLSAIGFLPLTLMWNVPALVLLVVFHLISHQEFLDELGAKIALGISFVLYLAVKMLFLPGLLSGGTPFVYLVPQEMASMLATIIPVLISVVALVAFIMYVRRPDQGQPPALFKAYLIFALVDSALTAILYAPRFFNPRG